AGNGSGFIDIAAPKGRLFTGLAFVAGTGFGGAPGEVMDTKTWAAFRAGALIAQGRLDLASPSAVVGFGTQQGFDELHYSSFIESSGVIDSAPALDSLRAQFLGATPTPEPSSLVLLGAAVVGIGM